MRTVLRLALPMSLAFGLIACGGEAPPADPSTAASRTAPTAVDPPPPAAAALDTASLRQRASVSLAANRLYSPAGDNAVEDYLALREREPADASVQTALVDLAPYVMIGAEQATVAEDFAEAQRLIALLARIDAEAPSVPRLRDALASAEATAAQREAEAQADAEAQAQAQAEAERLAAEQRAPSARPAAANPTAPTPTRPASPTASVPANPPSGAARASATTDRPAAPRTADAPPTARPAAVAPTPTRAAASAPAARALLQRVPPRFPEAAARRRLEGSVEVRVAIAADGRVDNVDVVRADPPGVFDREAVLAVRRWRYAPAEAPSEARVVLAFKRP